MQKSSIGRFELGTQHHVRAYRCGAKDSTVTLTGHVESYGQKHAAEMAMACVRGVKAVAEEIEVRLPYASRSLRPKWAWSGSAIDYQGG
jgi:hypothetical protein